MTVRKIQQGAIPEMIQLAAYAFHWEATEENRQRFTWLAQHSWNYGSFDGEQLASQVMVTPFEVGFLNQRLKMAGIGFVATYPEYRKQGRIDEIFKKLLADCRQEGILLSYLAPFSYGFYRRYGYEMVFEQLQITAQAQDWQEKGHHSGKVQRLSAKAARPFLKEIYQQTQTAKRGGLYWADWWQYYRFELGKSFHFAIYTDPAGKPQGYLVYRLEADGLIVEDCQYLTKEACWELRQFMAGHLGTISQIHWKRPYAGNSEEVFWASPTDDVKLRPYMMARIVSLEDFLQQIYPTATGTAFTLTVTADDYAPWNTGSYQFSAGEGFKKTVTGTGPQLVGSIQSLTQVLLGYKTAQELFHAGRLTGDLSAAVALDQITEALVPMLGDYF